MPSACETSKLSRWTQNPGWLFGIYHPIRVGYLGGMLPEPQRLPIFERFTDRARRVMSLAREEAKRFNHGYVATEHILLGLVKEGSGVATQVLKRLDVDLGKIRLEAEKVVQTGPDLADEGGLAQTPQPKMVIVYSMDEATNLKHRFIGTEHILLGLLREQEGTAGQVLINQGVMLEDVRDEVRRVYTRGPNIFSRFGRWLRNWFAQPGAPD